MKQEHSAAVHILTAFILHDF